MVDMTQDAIFTALVAATEEVIEVLANAGVRDARALVMRQRGWNSLQGHTRGLIPLAVWFIRTYPQHLGNLRGSTTLATNMGPRSAEARDHVVWQPIQTDLSNLLASDGADVISPPGTSPRSPRTAQEIADTYLSTSYGGGQPTGHAGNTVVKRTLKLLAHVLP